MEQKWDYDVVDLLIGQHRRIQAMCDELAARPDNHDNAGLVLERLVRLMAVHESAEEQVVHPVAARCVFGVDKLVWPRLTEEHRNKRTLLRLCDLGVAHRDFESVLAELSAALADHIAHEENEEFVVLRKQLSVNALQRMVGSVQAAEIVAPTRPHPHAGESATATLLTGPPLALFDRTRDAVRHWYRRGSRHPLDPPDRGSHRAT